MKLAIISDIHGNLLALEAVLADIALQGVDKTVNLGDSLSGPLQPAETADRLMALNLPTICGNHERQVLALLDKAAREGSNGGKIDPHTTDGHTALQLSARHVAWMASLPTSLALTNDDVLLCHGTPVSDLAYWLETVVPGFDRATGHPGVRAATADEVAARLGSTHASLVLCGHTHVPRVVQSGHTLVVNPGSVGLPAYDDLLPLPHIIETGSPHARYAVVERRDNGWQVDLRAVAYDHAAQSAVARRRGRLDWAHALATGRTLP